MHRIGIVFSLLLLAAGLSTTASAAIQFINATARATDGNLSPALAGQTPTTPTIHGGLYVTFKEVGLGNNAGTNYLVTADASAIYGCINGGSHNPRANNKQTVSGPVNASATFTSDSNGNVSGAIAVAPLPPGTLSCPPGQTQALVGTSYTNVVITDLSNGVSTTIPGTFSITFFQ